MRSKGYRVSDLDRPRWKKNVGWSSVEDSSDQSSSSEDGTSEDSFEASGSSSEEDSSESEGSVDSVLDSPSVLSSARFS